MKKYVKPDLQKLLCVKNDILTASNDNLIGWKWGDFDSESSQV